MFVYIVNLTTGQSVRVESAGDPTDHPTFWGRVESVETLGESVNLLSLVLSMSDPYAKLQSRIQEIGNKNEVPKSNKHQ